MKEIHTIIGVQAPLDEDHEAVLAMTLSRNFPRMMPKEIVLRKKELRGALQSCSYAVVLLDFEDEKEQ